MGNVLKILKLKISDRIQQEIRQDASTIIYSKVTEKFVLLPLMTRDHQWLLKLILSKPALSY